MYYVYFLKQANRQIYTGYTSNLRRRITEHAAGKVASTSRRLPVTLIGYEAYVVETDARRRERFLKTTEGKRVFRQQYRDILN